MKKNIGTSDRILRFFVALILLLLAWFLSSWIVLAFALFVFFEVVAGWCILYQIIGRNSCSIDEE